MDVSSPPAVSSRCPLKPKWERYSSAWASTKMSLQAQKVVFLLQELLQTSNRGRMQLLSRSRLQVQLWLCPQETFESQKTVLTGRTLGYAEIAVIIYRLL